MKVLAALLSILAASSGLAATAYVTDQLMLGVYAEQSTQGQHLATLHSGAKVDTLATVGESTQIRLADGTTGWVKSTYLTSNEPAIVRVKQLQEELDRNRATTPALAEAAVRSEVARLTRELGLKESELNAVRSAAAAGAAATRGQAGVELTVPRDASSVSAAIPSTHVGLWVMAVLAALGGGFWLGYATLARHVKAKFGGFKVY